MTLFLERHLVVVVGRSRDTSKVSDRGREVFVSGTRLKMVVSTQKRQKLGIYLYFCVKYKQTQIEENEFL